MGGVRRNATAAESGPLVGPAAHWCCRVREKKTDRLQHSQWVFSATEEKSHMRLAGRALQVVVTMVVTVVAYALVVTARRRYFQTLDPPAEYPHYHLLKQVSWLTAPIAGGIACGLTSTLFRRLSPVLLSLISSLLLVLAASLVSIKMGGLSWRDPRYLSEKAYWQCFALLLPTSAVATAWLVSRLRAVRARS